MCAQFLIRDNLVDFSKGFPAILDMPDQWSGRVFPKNIAPVLLWSDDHFEIKPMQYSLIPRWSKVESPKFATYNARLETVLEKPTWRKPFIENRCLVPMTGFIEWLEDENGKKYTANFSSKDEVILAAGVYETWRSKEGMEIDSFAIVTTEPTEFIENQGHDRMPVFPSEEVQKTWLKLESNDPHEIKALLDKKQEIEFSCEPIETPKPKRADKKKDPKKKKEEQLNLLEDED